MNKHSFKYHKEYRDIVEKIDGEPFWGTDGNMPKREYKSIEVKIRGKQVPIPKSAYNDLYESSLYIEFNSVHYDKDNDILYIVAIMVTVQGLIWFVGRLKRVSTREEK